MYQIMCPLGSRLFVSRYFDEGLNKCCGAVLSRTLKGPHCKLPGQTKNIPAVAGQNRWCGGEGRKAAPDNSRALRPKHDMKRLEGAHERIVVLWIFSVLNRVSAREEEKRFPGCSLPWPTGAFCGVVMYPGSDAAIVKKQMNGKRAK